MILRIYILERIFVLNTNFEGTCFSNFWIARAYQPIIIHLERGKLEVPSVFISTQRENFQINFYYWKLLRFTLPNISKIQFPLLLYNSVTCATSYSNRAISLWVLGLNAASLACAQALAH